jgi:hypothetical protein
MSRTFSISRRLALGFVFGEACSDQASRNASDCSSDTDTARLSPPVRFRPAIRALLRPLLLFRRPRWRLPELSNFSRKPDPCCRNFQPTEPRRDSRPSERDPSRSSKFRTLRCFLTCPISVISARFWRRYGHRIDHIFGAGKIARLLQNRVPPVARRDLTVDGHYAIFYDNVDVMRRDGKSFVMNHRSANLRGQIDISSAISRRRGLLHG